MSLSVPTLARQASPVLEEFLSRPTEPSHAVQFYEDDAYLCEVVARFLGAGLEAGEALVVIATEAHRGALTQRLQAKGFDVEAACATNRCFLLDARETLSHFMVGGTPDWKLFKEIIGSVLEKASRGDARPCVRAYGEMVDVLWQEGNPQAAIQLEQHWNALSKRYAFSLLCAYPMSNFHQEAHAQPFHEVCSTHSHVLPAETYSRLEDQDARLREVSLLQQRARALEHEIEHRKQVESALREALRTRDEFLCVAGHELKTPLTAVQLLMQSALSILAEEGGSARLQERLGKAVRHTERLATLVEELLDVSRMSTGQLELRPEAVDLAQLVRDALDRASDVMSRHGCTVRLLVEGPVIGSWDRRRLEQLVINLLSNAFRYGRDNPVDVVVKRSGERAQLIVRDHGIGISAEDQARIFNRFERAVSSKHFGGLGLGLWIVKQILEAHGGTIHVESELGQGAMFVVELPCIPASRDRHDA